MAKEDIVKYQFDKLTAQEQQNIAVQGGIASGEARRQKKSLREKAKLLMSLSIKDAKDKDKLKELGIDEKDMDLEMLSLVHMLNIIKKENFNSVGAFNSIKELTDAETTTNETPSININIIDNSDLEKTLYESNEGGDK